MMVDWVNVRIDLPSTWQSFHVTVTVNRPTSVAQ